jgi:hypothetical protein
MSMTGNRDAMTAAVRQGIADSGVDLSGLTRNDQALLVDSIVDAALVAVDERLGQAAERVLAEQEPVALTDGEQVLWEGRPFLSLSQHYTVTSERVRIRRGLIGRSTDNIELSRLQDVDVKQHPGERMANIGDITLYSANKSDPVVVLENVHSPEVVVEIIRKAMLMARRRHGVRIREDLTF